MKKVQKDILHLVISISILASGLCMSSCGSFMVANTDVLGQIKQGMSQEEVIDLLGTPNYRRIKGDVEELEHNKNLWGNSGQTTVITRFANNRLIFLDSFPTPAATTDPQPPVVIAPTTPDNGQCAHRPGKYRPMSSTEFEQFYQQVRKESFKQEKLEYISIGASRNSFSCDQCIKMMKLFTFDDDRLAVLEVFAHRIYDRGNFIKIIDCFTFSQSKDKAKSLLMK